MSGDEELDLGECHCGEDDSIIVTEMVLEGILMPVFGMLGLIGNGLAVLVFR